MQFNDTSNNTGIIQFCEKYTKLGYTTISGDTTLLKEFTGYINNENNDVWHLIFNSCAGWQYDDSNQTDLPQATSNIVSGTSKYALPASAFTIRRIEVKDAGGNWVKLKPIARGKIDKAIGMLETQSGTPSIYTAYANEFEMFPVPNYNSNSGYRVFFDRGQSTFIYTDTTKTPGFFSNYHDILPLGASIRWLKINTPESPSLPQLKDDYAILRSQIVEGYAARFSDDLPNKITTKIVNYE